MPDRISRRAFLERLGRIGLAGWLWDWSRALAAAADRKAPLVVGGTLSLTGPLAPLGLPACRALQLWHEQMTACGGVGGRPVRLWLEDDESAAEGVARRYERMAPSAHVFIGPYGSALTAAMLPVCRRTGIPAVLPSAGDPGLDLRDPSGRPCAPPVAVSILPPNDQALVGAVEWAAAYGARRMALLFRNDPFSQQVRAGALRRAVELGLTIVWDRAFESAAGIWEAAYLEHESGDLLLGGGYQPGGEADGFLPDAREITLAFTGKGRRLALLVAPTFGMFHESLGDLAEGVLGNTNWKPWFSWPGSHRFVAAFQERWDAPPDTHAAAAFAAGELIRAVIEQVVAAVPGEDLADLPFRLRTALAVLRTTTLFGPYAVDGSGHQWAHRNSILQWQQGKLARVWPEQT